LKKISKVFEILRATPRRRPGCVVRDLRLRRPIMLKTAAYGHFGRDDVAFTWEIPKELAI
jgi:S-adenosylmethionine synthetase